MPINTEYVHPDDNKNLRWNSTIAEPVKFPNGTTEYAYRHPNGGGWVSVSSFVSHSVYVHSLGCIYGGCNVIGNVQVNAYGQIYDGARVSGDVRVSYSSTDDEPSGETARIKGLGTVSGTVIVNSNAEILLNSNTIMGSITVAENTSLNTSEDICGTYTTNDTDMQDIAYPTGPQAHSDYNPITRSVFTLGTGPYTGGEDDFDEIIKLNKRDQYVPVDWDPAEVEDPDEEYTESDETPIPGVNPPVVQPDPEEEVPPVAPPLSPKPPPAPTKPPSPTPPPPAQTPAPHPYPVPTLAIKYGPCTDEIMDKLTECTSNISTGVRYNLEKLCQFVLTPIKKQYPNMGINSGYRPGNTSSQHGFGMAADIRVPGKTPLEVASFIKHHLQFCQLIIEYSDPSRVWIHISYVHPGTPHPYTTNLAKNKNLMDVATLRKGGKWIPGIVTSNKAVHSIMPNCTTNC